MVAALTLGGCVIIAPILDSFQKAGATESGRQGELQSSLKLFYQAQQWGRPEQTMLFVREDLRESMLEDFLRQNREERLVDTKIEYINWGSGSHDAKVDMLVKYYRAPYYIVTERRERQSWEFSFVDGWRLTAREVKSETKQS